MRVFAVNEFTEKDGDTISHYTEDDIRETYYPFVLKSLERRRLPPMSFEECLDDWIICNWAWEVTEEKREKA